MKRTFLAYIHYIRGLAILLIVAVHCIPTFPWTENSLSFRVYHSLLDNSTIIFVFIAGFLFQHLYYKRFSYKEYLIKKVRFVVLPYLLLSLPAVINHIYFGSEMMVVPEEVENSPDIVHALYLFGTGKHLPPFWFIPMIVVFYLMAPLLLRLDKSKIFNTYIFPVVLFGGFFIYKYGYFSNTIMSFLYFLPVYLMGMWASRHKDKITGMGLRLLIPLLLVYLAIFLLEVGGVFNIDKLHNLQQAHSPYVFHFSFSKFKVCLLCFILLNAFYLLNDRKIKILLLLGDYSFGIYFLHFYFIIIIQKFNDLYQLDLYMNAITFMLYTLFVTLACLAVVAVIKKLLPGKSRLIIGS